MVPLQAVGQFYGSQGQHLPTQALHDQQLRRHLQSMLSGQQDPVYWELNAPDLPEPQQLLQYFCSCYILYDVMAVRS